MTSVDWARAEQATLHLQQRYWYTYNGPVTDMRQRLIMIPPAEHLQHQRLLSFALDVRGAEAGVEVTWHTDTFNNRVCSVDVPRVERVVEFDGRYTVERRRGVASAPEADWAVYRQPTALTAPDERLYSVAQEIAWRTTDQLERAEQAHEWASAAIVYQVGVTGVRTPAAMALHLGRGVCQDYAHLLLCVLRLLDIPARYVSGQLLGEGVPHAWVEALVEGNVIAYDPTHHRHTRLDYVTVAVGRDFADVTPTSGVFSGAATGALGAAKLARVLTVVPRSTDTGTEDAA